MGATRIDKDWYSKFNFWLIVCNHDRNRPTKNWDPPTKNVDINHKNGYESTGMGYIITHSGVIHRLPNFHLNPYLGCKPTWQWKQSPMFVDNLFVTSGFLIARCHCQRNKLQFFFGVKRQNHHIFVGEININAGIEPHVYMHTSNPWGLISVLIHFMLEFSMKTIQLGVSPMEITTLVPWGSRSRIRRRAPDAPVGRCEKGGLLQEGLLCCSCNHPKER